MVLYVTTSHDSYNIGFAVWAVLDQLQLGDGSARDDAAKYPAPTKSFPFHHLVELLRLSLTSS